tara:strand:+ start:1926 stop:2174 length:249 start_codon:yes stop_codon:yes gene_type:complete
MKVILLTNNVILLAKIEEVGAEIGEPDCRLINPYRLNISDSTLSPWMVDVSEQSIYMISSDKILTIADPTEELSEKYNSLVK